MAITMNVSVQSSDRGDAHVLSNTPGAKHSPSETQSLGSPPPRWGFNSRYLLLSKSWTANLHIGFEGNPQQIELTFNAEKEDKWKATAQGVRDVPGSTGWQEIRHI